MDAQGFCTNCGRPLPQDARFCPRCGAEAAAAVPAEIPSGEPAIEAPPPAIEYSGGAVPEGPRSRTWLLVPLVIAVLAGLTLAVLSRMPFGGEPDAKSHVSASEPQQAPTDSGRIVEVDPNDPRVLPNSENTIAPPPATAEPAAPPETRAPRETAPAPQDLEDDREVSESDAATSLLDYLQSNDVYGVDSACLGIRNLGYVNAGYTFEAMDQCDTRSLGKWRVDATNGDIYRRRPDGRYLAP